VKNNNEVTPQRHARFKYDEGYSLERVAHSEHSLKVLESLKRINIHSLNKYVEKKALEREEQVQSRNRSAKSKNSSQNEDKRRVHMIDDVR
jgi:hypothetical protein